ncbi:MAG: hypothetical protein JXA04_01285 [Gammaproteobacteria bacterium]|nr:hypothetical protein [Gammaproteobacteria bacterium]
MHMILCYVPKITAAVLGISVIAAATPLEGPLQYGALGLCALMCFGVYKIHKDNAAERADLLEKMEAKDKVFAAERTRLVTELQTKDAQFIEVINNTNEILQALTEAIKIKKPGEKESAG